MQIVSSEGSVGAFTGGVLIAAAVAASAGVQSPSAYMTQTGYGWKTDAVAASQPVDYRQSVLPIQGAAAPGLALLGEMRINGGSWLTVLHISSSLDDNSSGTLGQGNCYGGYGTGHTTTTGYNNTGWGDEVLRSVTTGRQLTAIGSRALRSVTTGIQHTGLGQGALNAVTTGNYDTAAGFHAGKTLTGSDCAYFGWSCGEGNVASGNANAGFGSSALKGITTAAHVAAFGYGAGQLLTTGSFDLFAGSGAGISVTTGSDLVLAGYRAGYTSTPANACTTATQSVHVGSLSGQSGTTQLTNAITLGYAALIGISNAARVGNDSVRSFGFGGAPPVGRFGIWTTETVNAGTITPTHTYTKVINGVAWRFPCIAE